MSLHPPHLVDTHGSLIPAALIPFCAYQTNMTLLGRKTQGINFTACSQFQPTVLEGQLCYALNLTSIYTGKTREGKKGGLLILLDQGGQSSQDIQEDEIDMEDTLDLESSGVDAGSARIYLNTMASFSGYSSGSYALTALKKMTGTDSFLNQTDEEKNCRI